MRFSLATAHKAFSADTIGDPALRARFEKTIEAFLSLAEAAKNHPCIKRARVELLGEPPGTGADRVDPVFPSAKTEGSIATRAVRPEASR